MSLWYTASAIYGGIGLGVLFATESAAEPFGFRLTFVTIFAWPLVLWKRDRDKAGK